MPAPAKEAHASVAIRSERDPRRFLDLQRRFYVGDRDYVPPVTAAEAWQLDPRRNPFFAHAEVGFFSAWRGDACVGRVSVCRDRLHDEFHGDRVGFFGHFEAADADAAQALVEHAATWCGARGATELRGPVDLSTNNRCGLRIDDGGGPPVMMMPHNPPHYADWLARAGLEKAKDLVALWGTSADLDRKRIGRIAEHLQRRSQITLRNVDMARFDAECDVLWDLYERIWERNWGFVPMPRDEFLAQARDLKKVAHPSLLHIAEAAGKPVAFALAVPDTNVAAKACNGRLFPFGWWKFLQALKRTHTIRVLTLGVIPEFRRTGVDMLLMHRVTTHGEAAGFNACEASWILEDNRDMIGPLETMGFKTYRRYRIYRRTLA